MASHFSDNGKISVIIPVYNADRFLDQCIESVLHQTDSFYEVILVDDGSNDSSPAICDEWASKDPRIMVSHRENRGVSASRNFGMEMSTGDYICFLDADDILPETALKDLRDALRHSTMPISVGAVMQFYPNGNTKTAEKRPASGDIPTEEFLRQMIPYRIQYSWGKLYKREILKDTNGEWLHFREDLYQSEDVEWLTRVLVNVPGVNYTEQIVYQYRRGERGSATTAIYQAYDKPRIFSALAAYDGATVTLRNAKMKPVPSFLRRKIYFILTALDAIYSSSKKVQYQKDVLYFKKLFRNNFSKLILLARNREDLHRIKSYYNRYHSITKR